MNEKDEWISSRPESVRKLIEEFPLGSVFNVKDTTLYLVGYTEDEMLIVSEINPSVDYEGATANKKYLCADHFRKY